MDFTVGRSAGFRRGRTAAAGGLATDLSADAGLRAAYAAHGPELYRFALRQLRDEGTAQEAVQEVFLRAWRSADRFDPEVAGLRVWLFAIARTVVMDQTRRLAGRRASQSTGPGLPTLLAEPGLAESMLDRWLVEEALRRLSGPHRAVLVEAYLRGRPCRELAAEVGVPAGVLRSRIFYALKALHLAMEEMGVEP
ncbi:MULTISPECIES: sigma-70 family RNA polymerase sigma factor [unclassified Crossiella]|uniref:sigma-70 family RNA polymerase sigma factor n=1 Tax=unclassified Crossiella TaxID=2620835 RepID=UPI001FFF7E30|nr:MULTISPECIES: sigma-70 family RNA polymerase sigma factor [unclassified Crossiella]MCK2242754.1 sigma-70 family RNA polymerase sigma factor [Crossiella sp. S99.2]MCK2256631.1 sigma-70 family RNA polymerase sigma factor [Crossiella sp. S99.1]